MPIDLDPTDLAFLAQDGGIVLVQGKLYFSLDGLARTRARVRSLLDKIDLFLGEQGSSEEGTMLYLVLQGKKDDIVVRDRARAREAIRCYEANIGVTSAVIVQRIEAAVDDYGSDAVVRAIETAVAAERRSWNYVAGILMRGKTQGTLHTGQAAPGATPAKQQVIVFPDGSSQQVLI